MADSGEAEAADSGEAEAVDTGEAEAVDTGEAEENGGKTAANSTAVEDQSVESVATEDEDAQQ